MVKQGYTSDDVIMMGASVRNLLCRNICCALLIEIVIF